MVYNPKSVEHIERSECCHYFHRLIILLIFPMMSFGKYWIKCAFCALANIVHEKEYSISMEKNGNYISFFNEMNEGFVLKNVESSILLGFFAFQQQVRLPIWIFEMRCLSLAFDDCKLQSSCQFLKEDSRKEFSQFHFWMFSSFPPEK